MTLMDGKMLSAKIKDKLAEEIKGYNAPRTPCLAVIIVGEDPASKIYVRNKKLACEKAGITSLEYALDEATSAEQLLELIDELNKNSGVDGILVQLPLPKHLDEKQITGAISPEKDVDAFLPSSAGLVMLGSPVFLPCTPAGIMELLDEYGIDPAGKECVVVGRSNIVGKPCALLLLAKNGTVTVCHSKTKNLAEITRRADILVAAVGKPKLLGADMVKEGAVVIDVGMNRTENGLCGDVDFDAVKDKASFITPVPGGVGPMTIAMLLKNTVTSWKRTFSL